MPRAVSEDPLKVFRFAVEQDGFARAGFRDVQGLEASIEVAEYREGGDNETVKKSAGLTTYNNITLMRGQIIDSQAGGNDDLWNWIQAVHQVTAEGNSENYRRDLDIVQYDATYAEARRWSVHECFPVRFKPFADLNGVGNDNSVEELELAHEGFELVSG